MDLTLIKTALAKQPIMYQKRALASLAIVDGIDDVLNAFLARTNGSMADILLDVYGLLQTLFVGIDALYDLVIGTTQYKYHININQNPVLRELKYVRNDIVGHPTNRTYDPGVFGFSIIREDLLNREDLIYDTYVVSKNKDEHTSKRIVFKALIDAFKTEKTLILNGLNNFLTKKPYDTNIVSLSYALVNNAINHRYNPADLATIRTNYEQHNNHKIEAHDRFIWRLDLLDLCFVWVNNDFQELINYLRCHQAYKLYEIACNLSSVAPEKVFIPLPKVLVAVYRFLKKVPNALPYIETIADLPHPLFEYNIKQLLKFNPPKMVAKLLNWMLKFNDANYVYLIGSGIKNFKKK